MNNAQFDPGERIAFVEYAGTDRERMAVRVLLKPETVHDAKAYCAKRGFHTMRFLRECFALGLEQRLRTDASSGSDVRSERAIASPRKRAAEHALPDDLADRWRQHEAEQRARDAAASDDQLPHGF